MSGTIFITLNHLNDLDINNSVLPPSIEDGVLARHCRAECALATAHVH
jgi:hypothetical protein